jgi:hypothetical protein
LRDICRFYKLANAAIPPRDSLKHFKCSPNSRLARAVSTKQQNGRALAERQFKILQTSEIMNVEPV